MCIFHLYSFLFIGVNKNRKLVAFAERGERPHVVVYDLEARKRKTVLRYEYMKLIIEKYWRGRRNGFFFT